MMATRRPEAHGDLRLGRQRLQRVVDDGLVVPRRTGRARKTSALTDLRAGGAPRLSPSDGTEIYATYLGTAAGCVHGFALGTGPADGGGACLSVEADASVREPGAPRDRHPDGEHERGRVRRGASGVGLHEGQLAFATQQTGGQTFLADCGAALPALVPFPETGGGARRVLRRAHRGPRGSAA